MKKDYTIQALIKGAFAASCLLLIIKILSGQIQDLFLFYLRKSKWIQNIGFMVIAILLSCGVGFQSYAQCTGCTFTAPTDGTSFNFNGNQTLCITANVSNISWNMNGTGNKICVATGVVWNQPNGGNLQASTVIDVYGTLNLGTGINVNGTPPNAIINVHAGATLNSLTGFGNGITINNDGIVNFTGNGNVDFVGSSVFNNSGTLNALTTTNFHISGGATINNSGNIHIANIENEDGFLNNTATGVLIVDRNFNNHGDFQNVGDFQLPCNTLSGAAGATSCAFRVGDKGVGKTFVTNSCIKVMNADVVFDGAGTVNSGIEIGNGYNLTINKTVTGTNGSFLVKGGTSTINLSGNVIGTNMKFYDVNTAGNSFDNNFNINTPSNFTVNSSAGCSSVTACTAPTNVTASSNSPVSEGGAINLTSTSTGGTTYAWAGPNSYSSTLQNPTIAIATLSMAGTYTVTVTSSGTCIATATTLVAITPTCTPPNIVATTVTQATCNGAIANNDAKIAFTSTGGNKYGISVGTTYSGAAYASALVLSTGSGSLLGIANPATATSYTIRVFNGADTCFKDITVILNPKSCVVPCESKCITLKVVINK
jgi:hypothetical protein